MNVEEESRALRVNGEALNGVGAGAHRVSDAPISAQALLGLDLFETLERDVLWIATDTREMNRLRESLRSLAADDADIHLFQPMERDPAVFGEHLKLVELLRGEKRFFIVTDSKIGNGQ